MSQREISTEIDQNYGLDENGVFRKVNIDPIRNPGAATDGISLVENYQEFKDIYKNARRQVKDAENPLEEYSVIDKENKPDSFLVPHPRGGVWRIGKEIESIDEESMEYELGEWLHNSELTEYPDKLPYKSGTGEEVEIDCDGDCEEGYDSCYGTHYETYDISPQSWRYEEDCTVDVEVVSPPMYDNPEDMTTLVSVLNKMDDLGFKSTGSTGGHIHINTDTITKEDFGRLALIQSRFEDVIYRLSANPARSLAGRIEGDPLPQVGQRGTMYAQSLGSHISRFENGNFNEDEETQYLTSYGQDLKDYTYREALFNLREAEGEGGHLEFRSPDGSLEPPVTETHMKLGVALIAASMRPETTQKIKNLPLEPLGTHKTRREASGAARRNLTGEEWEEDTRSFRQLIDLLFTSQKDKEQMVTLFAMTNWN